MQRAVIVPHQAEWPAATTSLAQPVTVTLRSGLAAVLRPLTPSDRDAYLAGFEHVGPASRRLRFHAAKPVLLASEVRYFVQVDHRDHEAIIADVDGEVLGVARFVRDRRDPGMAEIGIVVADEWQGHGAGTALLRRLVERAVEEGIERLHATVLHDNAGMFATFRRLRLSWRTVSSTGGVDELEIPIRWPRFPDPLT
jgi:RimJ/RimL family protein N-acetyltransferase